MKKPSMIIHPIHVVFGRGNTLWKLRTRAKQAVCIGMSFLLVGMGCEGGSERGGVWEKHEGKVPLFLPNNDKGDPGQAPVGKVWEGAEEVGALPGTYGVSGDGQFSYELGFAAASGIAGMEPRLGFVYTSSGGVGAAGVGMTLTGLSAITRCGLVPLKDGVGQEITLTPEDRLCLEGERLEVISGTYGKDGAVYRTRKEGNVRVKEVGDIGALGTWFEVALPSGVKQRYGSRADSRMEVSWEGNVVGGQPSLGGVGMTWALASVEDPFGNRMEYRYGKHTVTGHKVSQQEMTFDTEQWLRAVEYGHNPTAGVATPTRRLTFLWEAYPEVGDYPWEKRRPENRASFYGAWGLYTTQSQRLAEVSTETENGTVWTYTLKYADEEADVHASAQVWGGTSGRSRLVAVTQCFSKGGCVPETRFSWDVGEEGYTQHNELWQKQKGEDYGGLVGKKTPHLRFMNEVYGDITGDGIADLIHPVNLYKYAPFPEEWVVWEFRAGEQKFHHTTGILMRGFPKNYFAGGDGEHNGKFSGAQGGPTSFVPYLGEYDGTGGAEVFAFLPSLDIRALALPSPTGLGPTFLWGENELQDKNPDLQYGVYHPRTSRGVQVVTRQANGKYAEILVEEPTKRPWLYATVIDLDHNHLTDLVVCLGNRRIDEGYKEGKGSYALGTLQAIVNRPGVGLDVSHPVPVGSECGYFDYWTVLDGDGDGMSEFLLIRGQKADGAPLYARTDIASTYMAFEYDPRNGGSFKKQPSGLKFDAAQRWGAGPQKRWLWGPSPDLHVDVNGDGLVDVLRFENGSELSWYLDDDVWAEGLDYLTTINDIYDEEPSPPKYGGLRLYMNTGAGFTGGGMEAAAKFAAPLDEVKEGGEAVLAEGIWVSNAERVALSSLMVVDDNGDGGHDMLIRDPSIPWKEDTEAQYKLWWGLRGVETTYASDGEGQKEVQAFPVVSGMVGGDDIQLPAPGVTYEDVWVNECELAEDYMDDVDNEGDGDEPPSEDDEPPSEDDEPPSEDEDNGDDPNCDSGKKIQRPVREHRGRVVRDINGDGLSDLLLHHPDETWEYWVKKGSYERDVVVKIQDGVGKTVEVDYTTLQDSEVYEERWDAEASWPQRLSRSSERVVKVVREDTGLGPTNKPVLKETAYTYYNLVCDNELGCLGPQYMQTRSEEKTPTGSVVRLSLTHRNPERHDGYGGYLGGVERVATVVKEVGEDEQFQPYQRDFVTWRETTTEVAPTAWNTYRAQIVGQSLRMWEVLEFSNKKWPQSEQGAVTAMFCLMKNGASCMTQVSEALVAEDTFYVYDDEEGYVTDVTTVRGGEAETQTTIYKYLHNHDTWLLGLLSQQITTTHNAAGSGFHEVSIVPDMNHGRVKLMTREPHRPAYRVMKGYTYDAFGQVKTQTLYDRQGKTRTKQILTWSDDGLWLERVENGLGHATTAVWDKDYGVVLQSKNAQGYSEVLDYDSFGRVLKARAHYGTTLLSPATEFAYEAGTYDIATVVVTAGKDQPTKVTEFDRLGRLRSTLTDGPLNQKIGQALRYDSLGRVVEVDLPHKLMDKPAGMTHITYDGLSRPTRTTAPDGTTQTVTYRGREVEARDELGRVSWSLYNALGQKVEWEQAKGAKDVETVRMCGEYNVFSSLTKVRPCSPDPRKGPMEMGYDDYGNLMWTKDAALGLRAYRYNEFFELTDYFDAKSQHVHLVYDELGRQIQQDDPDGVTEWTYDEQVDGLWDRVISSQGHGQQVVYDSLHRQAALEVIIDHTPYRYDILYDEEFKTRTRMLSYPQTKLLGEGPRFAVGYGYDAQGYLTNLYDGRYYEQEGGVVETMPELWTLKEQDAWGHITKEVFGNGVETTHNFNPLSGRLHTQTATVVQGPNLGLAVQDLFYSWWNTGWMMVRNDKLSAAKDGLLQEEQMNYDSLGRLASVHTLRGEQVQPIWMSYDPYGNVQSRSFTGTYTYENERLATVQGALKTMTYWYDENGNRILSKRNDTLTAYGYNVYNQLTSVTSLPETEMAYAYGPGLGRVKMRDEARNEATLFIGPFMEQTTKDKSLSVREVMRVMGPAGVLMEWSRVYDDEEGEVSEQTRYLHREALGSVNVVTDEQGAVVERYHHNAWGQPMQAHNWLVPKVFGKESEDLGLLPTRIGFTGHLNSNPQGLMHMQGRDYDPELGQFMQADPIQPLARVFHTGALNRYAYVENNPTTFIDPSGFCSWNPSSPLVWCGNEGGGTGGEDEGGSTGGLEGTPDGTYSGDYMNTADVISADAQERAAFPGPSAVIPWVGGVLYNYGTAIQECLANSGSPSCIGGVLVIDPVIEDVKTVEKVYDKVLNGKIPSAEEGAKAAAAVLLTFLGGLTFEVGGPRRPGVNSSGSGNSGSGSGFRGRGAGGNPPGVSSLPARPNLPRGVRPSTQNGGREYFIRNGSDNYIEAYLETDNTIFMVIEAQGPKKINGYQLYDSAMHHFDDTFGLQNIDGIKGAWSMESETLRTNLDQLNKLTATGMPLEQAVSKVWSGIQAERWGFTQAEVLDFVGTQGNYTDVTVLYTRP